MIKRIHIEKQDTGRQIAVSSHEYMMLSWSISDVYPPPIQQAVTQFFKPSVADADFYSNNQETLLAIDYSGHSPNIIIKENIS